MTRRPEPRHVKKFSVRLGHTTLVVEADSVREAIEIARRRLGAELPRMWDVIYRMADSAFCVEDAA